MSLNARSATSPNINGNVDGLQRIVNQSDEKQREEDVLKNVGMATLAALGLTLVAAPASANPLGFGAQLQGAVPALTEQVQRRWPRMLYTNGEIECWSDGSIRPGPHARSDVSVPPWAHAGVPTLLFENGVIECWSNGAVRPGPYSPGNYQVGRVPYGGHYGAPGNYRQHRRGGPVMVWTNGTIERWSDGSVRPGPHARHRR